MDKIIIVGAGLSGATIARLFADGGRDVTVVDKNGITVTKVKSSKFKRA